MARCLVHDVDTNACWHSPFIQRADYDEVPCLRPPAAVPRFFILPYMRRRQRLSTAMSLTDNPAIAAASKARAMGMRWFTSDCPFGDSLTVTSRLLLTERVRVTRPLRIRRVMSRDKVETSMLVRSARSICRWLPRDANTAITRHIAILKPCPASASLPNCSATITPTRLVRYGRKSPRSSLARAFIGRRSLAATGSVHRIRRALQKLRTVLYHCIYNRCNVNYHEQK